MKNSGCLARGWSESKAIFSMNMDKLRIKIYPNREEMGKAAAADIANCIRQLLAKKPIINMIFAAAPSQNEMLRCLCSDETVEWERINAFHMDEYIGLPADAPQGFANYLRTHIFDRVPFRSVNTIHSDVDIAAAPAECARYAALLEQYPCDIVCMGIGENGHIAFNDPHVADFHDPATVKVVDLDSVCRMQQVNDGCFARLEDVPEYAVTVTVSALMAAPYHFCVVPGHLKARAVYDTVYGAVCETCPATVLRQHDHSELYCDRDSGHLLNTEE